MKKYFILILFVIFFTTFFVKANAIVLSQDTWGKSIYNPTNFNGFWSPYGIVTDGNNLWLTEKSNNRLTKGSVVNSNFVFNNFILLTNENKYPGYLDISESNLFVTEYKFQNKGIRIFDLELNELNFLPFHTNLISVACYDKIENSLFVLTETADLMLIRIDGQGIYTILSKTNFYGSGKNLILKGRDMIYAENKLLIADFEKDRVQEYYFTNNTFYYKGKFVTAVNEATGLFYDKNNKLWFVTYDDNQGRVMVIDKENKLNFSLPITPWGHEIWGFRDCCILDNGLLINPVVDTIINRDYLAFTRFASIDCLSNSINDANSTGNTNNLIEPGESFDVKLTLNNLCWTNISPQVWLNIERTIYANGAWPTYMDLTNYFDLPTNTGLFDTISHRTAGIQTNSFSFFMPTNPVVDYVKLIFDVFEPNLQTNFTVETTLRLNNPVGLYAGDTNDHTMYYFPAEFDIFLDKNGITNIPFQIFNVGTRELISVAENNGSVDWWRVENTTNIVQSYEKKIVNLTIDTSALPGEGLYKSRIDFDENAYWLWNINTSNFYDADNWKSMNINLTFSSNAPPIFSAQTNLFLPETNNIEIVLHATDDQTDFEDLEFTMIDFPADAVINSNIITWLGSYDFAKRTGDWIYSFTVKAEDDGISPQSSSQIFYVTRTQINRSPAVPNYSFFWKENPLTIQADEPFESEYKIYIEDNDKLDIPYLALEISNANFSCEIYNRTTLSWGVSYTFKWENPEEGEYSNYYFWACDNGVSPLYGSRKGPTIIVVPEPMLFLIFNFIFLIIFAQRNVTEISNFGSVIFLPYKSYKDI